MVNLIVDSFKIGRKVSDFQYGPFISLGLKRDECEMIKKYHSKENLRKIGWELNEEDCFESSLDSIDRLTKYKMRVRNFSQGEDKLDKTVFFHFEKDKNKTPVISFWHGDGVLCRLGIADEWGEDFYYVECGNDL